MTGPSARIRLSPAVARRLADQQLRGDLRADDLIITPALVRRVRQFDLIAAALVCRAAGRDDLARDLIGGVFRYTGRRLHGAAANR